MVKTAQVVKLVVNVGLSAKFPPCVSSGGLYCLLLPCVLPTLPSVPVFPLQTRMKLDEQKASEYLNRFLSGDASIKLPRLSFALQHMYEHDVDFQAAVDRSFLETHPQVCAANAIVKQQQHCSCSIVYGVLPRVRGHAKTCRQRVFTRSVGNIISGQFLLFILPLSLYIVISSSYCLGLYLKLLNDHIRD
jgi:hypothetical protein